MNTPAYESARQSLLREKAYPGPQTPDSASRGESIGAQCSRVKLLKDPNIGEVLQRSRDFHVIEIVTPGGPPNCARLRNVTRVPII
jgi:hypothetical protein